MRVAATIALIVIGFVLLGADNASMKNAVRKAGALGEEWDGEHPAGLRCFFFGLVCFAMAAAVHG